MTTGDALLRAILTNPADDLPRLVYADWLEERGEGERAEHIRIQCESAKPLRCNYSRRTNCFSRRVDWDDVLRTGCKACKRQVGRHFRVGHIEEGAEWYRELSEEMQALPGWLSWGTMRGFLGFISMTPTAWIEHGPALVARHPITLVRMSGLFPLAAVHDDDGSGEHLWWDAGDYGGVVVDEEFLPAELFAAVWAAHPSHRASDGGGRWLRFTGRTNAVNALSVPALNLARKSADLPLLTVTTSTAPVTEAVPA